MYSAFPGGPRKLCESQCYTLVLNLVQVVNKHGVIFLSSSGKARSAVLAVPASVSCLESCKYCQHIERA